MTPRQAVGRTSFHDIARDGVRYIMEWNRDEGKVSITEARRRACREDSGACGPLEAYDYRTQP